MHLAPQLSENGPSDVGEPFEFARGAMLYGRFLYPFITVAADRRYRVLEAAARTRWRQMGITAPQVSKNGKLLEPKLAEVVEVLVKSGPINPKGRDKWTASRDLRNWSSYPGFQQIPSLETPRPH